MITEEKSPLLGGDMGFQIPQRHYTNNVTTAQFRTATMNAGIEPPADIVADGNVHRFATRRKSNAEAAAKAVVENAIAKPVAPAWSLPNPIQASLKPVPAFDAEALLPEVLRDWIINEADRMPCPPDFIAAATLVALGSVIGARCAIRPKTQDDWLIIPNLWGGIVGLPSAKKSPAISAALKPLDKLISEAVTHHEAEKQQMETEYTILQAQKDAIENRIKAAARDAKKGDLTMLARELQEHQQQLLEKPKLRRFKTNDSTVEKLGELLRDNPNGLLILRDELVGLIASWDKEGREGERAFYLESWNGSGSFDTDRIGRGSIFIPNVCLSIFGGIQPDKLIGYLEMASHALANDGMLQRFQLLVYPDDQPWEWRDRLPDDMARDRVFDIFDKLANFDPVNWGAKPASDFVKSPSFCFSPEAQDVFIEWSIDLHQGKLAAEEHAIIAQHLAKYDKLFPTLALIFHLVDCATTGKYGAVTKTSALRAAAWCDYLEAHARRCYGLLMDDGLRAAQALSDKIKQGKLTDGFTARDVRRNRWKYLTTDEAIQAALDWLEDEYWVKPVLTNSNGRHTIRYSIHPTCSAEVGGHHEQMD